MSKGPKHSGQNAKPSKKAGWRKKSTNFSEGRVKDRRLTPSEAASITK